MLKFTEFTPITWLKGLLWLHFASIAVSILRALLAHDTVIFWLQQLLFLGVILSLFSLRQLNDGYRKAALFRAVVMACNLLTALPWLPLGTLLTLAASVLSVISLYQECKAHAALVRDWDKGLAVKWKKLFIWSIILPLISLAATLVMALMGMVLPAALGAISVVLVWILLILQILLEMLYIRNLRRTIDLVPIT